MENTTPSSPFAGRSGLFFAGLAVIVVLFAAALWWLTRPTWAALYKDAGEANQAAILATLGQWQLPYRIREGTIEVPEDTVAAARMHLADAGVPGRGSVGFELFDQADYGMSEFSQKINYQRALEGELARTMMGTAEVQHARVHLTFKKSGLYRQAEEPAKASVVLRLRPDAVLDSQRVRGIQQLVASAVEGMSAERVVVLNENGQLLSSGDGNAAQPEQLRMTAQVEQDLRRKAENLLTRSLGYNAAEVSVRAQLNFDRVKSVRELPVGGGKEALQRSREVTSSESASGSNDSKRSQSTKESDFMVGKERAEIEHAAGRIERISVGVVLAAPQSEAGLKEMRNLLQATLGLDTARGDQLVIAYLPRSPAATAAPTAAAVVPGTPAVEISKEAATPGAAAEVEAPWLRWGVASGAGLLSLVLLGLWLSARKRARRPALAAQPRLSSVEREQLLVDLRRWLAEVR